MEYGFVTMADGSKRKVSRLILGTALFGGGIDEDAAFRMMDLFAGQGGNALDSARVYCEWLENGRDASERTVGRWIRSRGMENQIFLITKGGHPRLDSMHVSRLSPEEIRGDMEKSLDVLGLDRVDLYYLHRDDERLAVGGMMDALDELVRAGLTRAIGGSNWHARRLIEANDWARAHGKHLMTASEVQWSYVDFKNAVSDDTLVGMDEAELALYQQTDLAVMAYSSQSGGVFSCGYKDDLSDAAPKHRKYVSGENIRRYRALLERCAKEPGLSPSRVVLEHVTRHPKLNGFALIGCSSADQLKATLSAMAGA